MKIFFLLFALLVVPLASAQVVLNFTSVGAGSWEVPAGVTNITVEAWGGGGGGGGVGSNNVGAGGGAGGQYAKRSFVVIPGTTYNFSVGNFGAGGAANAAGTVGSDTTFNVSSVVAKGGAPGQPNIGAGGVGSTTGGVGDVVYRGGSGQDGVGLSGPSGGGGGGAGSTGAGGDSTGTAGGVGTADNGGNGGLGYATSSVGGVGNVYAAGGGGGKKTTGANRAGGDGAQGMLRISYTESVPEDSCTYGGSGDWNVVASDNCLITVPVVISGGRIVVTGSGTFTVSGVRVSGFTGFVCRSVCVVNGGGRLG